MRPTNETLMARYKRNLDTEAFDEIVSRFLGPALAVARQMLADTALAEDAVQETFLRVVRHRKQYVSSMPFSNWFYAILRNVCKDMRRRRRRQTDLMQRYAVGEPTCVNGTDVDRSDYGRLLAALPKPMRVVLTLRVVYDMSFREVAAALGISEEAAKKRAQRALRRLRKNRTALQLL